MRSIGRRFRQFREAQGMSQKEMAGVCTLTQASITNFEKGRVIPAVRHLLRLSRRFGLNIPWLLYGETSKPWKMYNTRDCYVELESLYFNFPEIRLLLLARLEEVKKLFHDEIDAFFKGKR